MRKLVLFDVDHTIVKYNVTIGICKQLFTPAQLFSFSSTLYQKKKEEHAQVMSALDHALHTKKFALVDEAIKHYIESLYRIFFNFFFAQGRSLKEIENEAKGYFEQKKGMLQSYCYKSALKVLENYVSDESIDIVLLSGGLQIIVDSFAKELIQYLSEKKDFKGALFSYGTVVDEKGKLEVLVGSRKREQVKEHVRLHKYSAVEIIEAYSDNAYCSDLPMLLAAEKGYIVSEPTMLEKIVLQDLFTQLTYIKNWS